MTKTEAEDLGDLLENLGDTFSIHYVTRGSKEREFRVIGAPRFAQRLLDEFLQDASMLALSVVSPDGRRVRLK
jgi:hypothetical protein